MRNLSEGGQGYTYLVTKTGESAGRFVLKRLKNVKRKEYFDREIDAYAKLSHPNVLQLVEHGETPKGKPYLVTPYCEGGSLEDRRRKLSLANGLELFLQMCQGVAAAHAESIFHLDLKPANIFLKNEEPVVGDFGICVIADNEIEMTSYGPHGSKWYCAPELRDQHIESTAPLSTADVYSLGKILYWLFTLKIYDGHEETYSAAEGGKRLANLFTEEPQFHFVDELVEGMVQREPYKRMEKGFSTAESVCMRVQQTLDRIKAGGRVLNLNGPMRCLFCAVGAYIPIENTRFRWIPEQERSRETNASSGVTRTTRMREDLQRIAQNFDGTTGAGQPMPLILICPHCGNVQRFRFDLAHLALDNWRP